MQNGKPLFSLQCLIDSALIEQSDKKLINYLKMI